MREIHIDFSSDNYLQQPKVFGGYEGEHDETYLRVRLPKRMIGIECSGYRFDFLTSEKNEISSPLIPASELDNDIITFHLTEQLTIAGKLLFNVAAILLDGDTVRRVSKTNTAILCIPDGLKGNVQLINPNAHKDELLRMIDSRILEKIPTGSGGSITVDQSFDPNSSNAQSGTAVSEALKDKTNIYKEEIVSGVCFSVSENAYEKNISGIFLLENVNLDNENGVEITFINGNSEKIILKYNGEDVSWESLYGAFYPFYEKADGDISVRWSASFEIEHEGLITDKADNELTIYALVDPEYLRNADRKNENELIGWIMSIVETIDGKADTEAVKNKVERKNLIPYPYLISSHEINGLTVTDNGDGTITVNGTATTQTTITISEVNLKEGHEYSLSGCPADGAEYTKWMLSLSTYQKDTGNGVSFVSSDNYPTMPVNIIIGEGATCDNLLFKPQLERGLSITPYSPPIPIYQDISNKQDKFAEVLTEEKDGCNGFLINKPFATIRAGNGGLSLEGYLVSLNSTLSDYIFCNNKKLQAVASPEYDNEAVNLGYLKEALANIKTGVDEEQLEAAVNEAVGDVDTALEHILALQNELLGEAV